VSGLFGGSGLDFGGGPLSNNGGTNSAFLASVDGAGSHRFSKSFGSIAQGLALAGDPVTGNVALGGLFKGSIDFGAAPLSSDRNGTDQSGFVATFDANGAPIWSRSTMDMYLLTVENLAFRADGDLLAVGIFGGHLAPGVAIKSMVSTRLEGATGATRWVESYGGSASASDSMHAVAIDPSGNMVFGGAILAPTIDFGGGTLTNAGGYDFFVGKLGP
jgi:hypothetical protein